ncbi:unnamed protein product [Closterium sp. NIES-53]
MAAQELRWLTYLLTDLGDPPRSPPVLYVDNKAMLALCREQRLEHRTKHIALRYFLAPLLCFALLDWSCDPLFSPTLPIGLLLEEFHDVLYAGHFGSNKTLAGIAKVYYWPHMANNMQKFVTSCDTCQQMKSSKQKKA